MGNLDSVIELKAKIKAIKPKNPCGCSGDMSGGGYDDTDIKNRLNAVENRPDNDTIYDDTALTQRVETLEKKPDSDTIYDDSTLVARVEELENKKSASLSVASLSNTGGTETQSTISQETNYIQFNYQKNINDELPNYINTQINSDHFFLATTAYVDNAVSNIQTSSPQGGSAASLYELNFAEIFPADMDGFNIRITEDAVLEDVISSVLRLDEFDIITGGTCALMRKKPVLEVEIDGWNDALDTQKFPSEFYKTTLANIKVKFGDESCLSDFVSVCKFLGKGRRVFAATASGGAYIDTGLKMNGAYTFAATGWTRQNNQSVLIGAYETNTSRTTLRILGSSNKLQTMWSANQEYNNSASQFDFNKEFFYMQKANNLYFTQGEANYTLTGTTHTITQNNENIPILLFNETPTATYNNGVIKRATIRDENMQILQDFLPYEIEDENGNLVVVMIEVSSLDNQMLNKIMKYGINADNGAYADKIYKPVVGSLVEVKQGS